jgi:hypothetical protein
VYIYNIPVTSWSSLKQLQDSETRRFWLSCLLVNLGTVNCKNDILSIENESIMKNEMIIWKKFYLKTLLATAWLRRLVTGPSPQSHPNQSMSDLWWTKWHWERHNWRDHHHLAQANSTLGQNKALTLSDSGSTITPNLEQILLPTFTFLNLICF